MSDLYKRTTITDCRTFELEEDGIKQYITVRAYNNGTFDIVCGDEDEEALNYFEASLSGGDMAKLGEYFTQLAEKSKAIGRERLQQGYGSKTSHYIGYFGQVGALTQKEDY